VPAYADRKKQAFWSSEVLTSQKPPAYLRIGNKNSKESAVDMGIKERLLDHPLNQVRLPSEVMELELKQLRNEISEEFSAKRKEARRRRRLARRSRVKAHEDLASLGPTLDDKLRKLGILQEGTNLEDDVDMAMDDTAEEKLERSEDSPRRASCLEGASSEDTVSRQVEDVQVPESAFSSERVANSQDANPSLIHPEDAAAMDDVEGGLTEGSTLANDEGS
jgi:hypothetical protein